MGMSIKQSQLGILIHVRAIIRNTHDGQNITPRQVENELRRAGVVFFGLSEKDIEPLFDFLHAAWLGDPQAILSPNQAYNLVDRAYHAFADTLPDGGI